ncbi:MAG: autotransporter outer membrane beta-barrel domain-containing protein, partial [Alphaproteobacteria bacterium]|nr:autotransporter outer membrane beta-barrel domain-containing protein [Alphaproteobacteria bacterium]
NYAAGKNEAFFNQLKSFGDVHSLTNSLDKLTGREMLSRFNFEDMTMMRELNFDMNEKLFHNKEKSFALAGFVSPMAFRGDTGSDARYSLYNKRDGKWSVGLGIAFTNVRSDNAHDDDDRRDTMYQMVVPVGYRTHGFNLMTSPRIGYARGKYDRTGFDNKNYDGTIEKRVYGLMNEARYPLAFGDWTLEPAAEFNILGYTQRGHEEDKDYALNIKSQNTYSVEGGVGLYLTKDKELTKTSKIKLTAGVAAYHEFADPYKLRVGMDGMDGTFMLRDEKRSDNRGVVRAGFDYDWSDYSLYGSIMSYIDKEVRTSLKSGFKWKF